MLVTGIREQNLPSSIEAEVLVDFIQEHFYNYTLDEVKLAFKLCVAGKLDLSEKDRKHYENFSCEYFGRVMDAYKSWAKYQKQMMSKQTSRDNQNEKLLAMPKKADWTDYIEETYKQFKYGKYNMELWAFDMYDTFVEKGEINENDCIFFIDIARDYVRRKEIDKAETAASEVGILANLKKVITDFNSNTPNERISQWAKRFAIEAAFKKRWQIELNSK